MLYWYLLWHRDYEREIAEAEVRALLGEVSFYGKIAESKARIDVDRTAYLAWGLEALCEAPDLPELCLNVRGLGLKANCFKIEVHKVRSAIRHGSHDIAARVGEQISGKVDLENPRERLLVAALENGWWFGRVLSRSHREWERQKRKGFTFSASIDPRLARALLNLVAKEGDTILDPCCGAGTIPIEAASLGMRCVGVDLNRKMAWHSRRNLNQLGVAGLICRGDARSFAGNFDAIVADLPGGRFSTPAPGFYLEAVKNLAHLAPHAVYVAMEDLSPILQKAGCEVEYKVKVNRSGFTRFVHVCVATDKKRSKSWQNRAKNPNFSPKCDENCRI